jgi:hypothetical protein
VLGVVTIVSSAIFWSLKSGDGSAVSRHKTIPQPE